MEAFPFSRRTSRCVRNATFEAASLWLVRKLERRYSALLDTTCVTSVLISGGRADLGCRGSPRCARFRWQDRGVQACGERVAVCIRVRTE